MLIMGNLNLSSVQSWTYLILVLRILEVLLIVFCVHTFRLCSQSEVKIAFVALCRVFDDFLLFMGKRI